MKTTYNLKIIVKTFLGRYIYSRLTWPRASKLALGFSLLYIGCGESGSNSALSQATSTKVVALPDTPETFAQIRAISPSQSCPHDPYYLTGDFSWNIVTGYDFDIHDVWEFNEDCTFREFNCGTVGYLIDGGKDFGNGIVHLMLLGYIAPKSAGCMPLGETSCSYGTDGAKELRLNCQLLTPLVKPFP